MINRCREIGRFSRHRGPRHHRRRALGPCRWVLAGSNDWFRNGGSSRSGVDQNLFRGRSKFSDHIISPNLEAAWT